MNRRTFSHNTKDSVSDEEGSIAKRTVTTTAKRRHVCMICKQSFNAKGHLNRHKVIHNGEQNHKCFICERSFSQRENLQRHFSTVHKGEKPYECDTCKRSFSSKAYLRKHVLIHIGENPICPICNKSIAWNLERHLLTHNKTESLVCNICKKSCSHQGNLKRHMNSHNGEKPTVCNKRYLMKHMKNHNGNELHSQTPSSDNPVRNISSKPPTPGVHIERETVFETLERSFICRVCDKSYTREQCFKRHLSFHFRKSHLNGTEKKRYADRKDDRSQVCGLCHKNVSEETCLKLHHLHCKGKFRQHPYSCISCLEEVVHNDKWNTLVMNNKETFLSPDGRIITNLSSADTNGNYTEKSWSEETEIKEGDNVIVNEEHELDNDFEGFGSVDGKVSDICKK